MIGPCHRMTPDSFVKPVIVSLPMPKPPNGRHVGSLEAKKTIWLKYFLDVRTAGRYAGTLPWSRPLESLFRLPTDGCLRVSGCMHLTGFARLLFKIEQRCR